MKCPKSPMAAHCVSSRRGPRRLLNSRRKVERKLSAKLGRSYASEAESRPPSTVGVSKPKGRKHRVPSVSSPECNKSEDENSPWQKRPGRPKLSYFVGRNRDRPGQTARGDVEEAEQEERDRDEHAAVNHGRQSQNKKTDVKLVLAPNARRENKK